MTVEQFNEIANYVRVMWAERTGRYEVIGIDGRVLFGTENARTAVQVAKDYEGDYAGLVQGERGWISLANNTVGCIDCGEATDDSRKVRNESGQHIGWQCESCYADTTETAESLRARETA